MEKFWWGVVSFRMMPMIGDNTQGKYRLVLVASLMYGFILNIRETKVDEIKIRATKTVTAFLFLCLITRLCDDGHVPIIIRVDDRVKLIKIHTFTFEYTNV